MAYQTGVIALHAKIKVRREGVFNGRRISALVDTTVGRIIFNRPIPQDLGYVDRTNPDNYLKYEIDFLVGKKQLGKIFDKCIKKHGTQRTSEVLDAVKAQGYKYSTKGAITVAVCDATIPPKKKEIIAAAEKEIDKVSAMYRRGYLSNQERYEKVIGIWEKATNDVTSALKDNLDRYNPIYMMASPSEQTIVKVLTFSSTLFHLVVRERDLQIQLFVPPTQVTLQDVLLMYHRMLLSVRKTAVLLRVSLYMISDRQAQKPVMR